MALYGYEATSPDDPLMKLAAESMDVLSDKLIAGGGIWAVDVFPIRAFLSPVNPGLVNDSQNFAVRYLPSWFPGAGFKRSATKWKKLIEAFVREPYEDCIRKIVSSPFVPPLAG